jgi:hypothetical protein
VSPPNLPTPEFFVPLGKLLVYVRSGNRFNPVHVDDIRAGRASVVSWQCLQSMVHAFSISSVEEAWKLRPPLLARR